MSSVVMGTVRVAGKIHLAAKCDGEVFRSMEGLPSFFAYAGNQRGRFVPDGARVTPFDTLSRSGYRAGAGVARTFVPIPAPQASHYTFAWPLAPRFQVLSDGVREMLKVVDTKTARAYEESIRPTKAPVTYAIETTSPDKVLMVEAGGSSAIVDLPDKIEAVREEIRREVREDVQNLKDMIGARGETLAPIRKNPHLPTRIQVLTEAEDLINGDRDQVYGGDSMNAHERIGKVWAALLNLDDPIPPATVAVMMVGLKGLRAVSSPLHRDSYVDMAGYAGLGAEAAEYERDKAEA